MIENLNEKLRGLDRYHRSLLLWRLKWHVSSHYFQFLPRTDEWSIQLLLAGRGSGKTKCAANHIAWWALSSPHPIRCLVMAPTANDIRFTCFEGDSGLLNTIPQEFIKNYNKSTFELDFTNGSHLRGISADSYERLRGPQFHRGWLDELAAYEYATESWDMMQFGMRLGKAPKVIVTTTPKPKELIWRLLKRARTGEVVVRRASSYANLANLAPTFKRQIAQYEGTKLGRQEIHAEVLDPFEAGIVKKQWLSMWPKDKPLPSFEEVIVSIDPSFGIKSTEKKTGSPDPTGLVVLGSFLHAEKGQNPRENYLLLDADELMVTTPELMLTIKKYMSIYWGKLEAKTIASRAKIEPPSMYKDASAMPLAGTKASVCVIERTASGLPVLQSLQAERSTIQCVGFDATTDKLSRLHAVSPLIYAGRLWVPESDYPDLDGKPRFKTWSESLIAQICTLAAVGKGTEVSTSTGKDDLCDALTQGLLYFQARRGIDNSILKRSNITAEAVRFNMKSALESNYYG